MGYHSAIKKNETLSVETTQVEPESILLGEASPKDMYHMVSRVCYIYGKVAS